MKTTGITRRMDELGRVVIPKEIRKNMHIKPGELLEISLNSPSEITLRKYSFINKDYGLINDLILSISNIINCDIVLINTSEVVFSTNDKYKGEEHKEDRKQFRRVIRYIKRWKNKKFSGIGNAEPPSIGITLIAVDKFKVSKKYDPIELVDKYNDLDAVLSFAKEIQKLFVYDGITEQGHVLYKIEYNLPSSLKFEADSNVFKKMS